MGEFVNTLDPEKFRRTNGMWNELMLNDPWSVGYEWESFYYELGDYRTKQLQKLPTPTVEVLNNEQLIRTNRQQVDQLDYDLKNHNTQNGRTKAELVKKGKILYDNVKTSIPSITLEECIECVRFRVICETWNGIIVRERNTIMTLSGIFPNYTFEKKDGDFDHHYAVDYEMKKESEIICGIQIKPKSYTFSTPYLNKARIANQAKNAEYTRKLSKPVFDVISKGNGEIQNPEVIKEIKSLTE